MILAGDIGGTNTRLAMFAPGKSLRKPVALAVYPSSQIRSLEECIRQFVETFSSPVRCACFGVAGPISGERCKTTNLPWVVDSRLLAAAAGVKKVRLINDLVASACGIEELSTADVSVLNRGKPEPGGNRVLISAGTGLGQAGLYCNDGTYHPVASEGGHVDFAPRNESELGLLRYLSKRYSHVSYERILSGPGLFNIYRFLRGAKRGAEPRWLTELLSREDAPAVISESALRETNGLCVQALDMFVSIYGAETGNLALKFKATGGVYLGGGIAPKILPKLKTRIFLDAFFSKGRLSRVVSDMPVRVVLNDKIALLGAARASSLVC